MRHTATGSRLPRTFLAVAALLGTLYLVVNPPFAVNDEDVHLARIYELSQGQLLTRSDTVDEYHQVPSDYLHLGEEYEKIAPSRDGRVSATELWQRLHEPPASGPLVRMRARAGAYSPFAYHLQIPVIWLARWLGLGVMWQVYLARLASLAVYLGLAYRAVSLTGGLSWLFIAMALTPMALTQAAGVSADGLVIGLSLLFFAQVTRHGVLPGAAPSRGVLFELVALLSLLTLIKPVYCLAGVALTCLRWEGPRATWLRYGCAALSTLVALGLHLAWSRLHSSASAVVEPSIMDQQLLLLREAPWRAVKIALTTVLYSGDELLIESVFVRHRIAPGMRFLGGLVSIVYVQLLLALAWGASRRHRQSAPALLRQRLLALGVSWLGMICAVPAALYVCCSEVGSPYVERLQGRYFLPAMPAALLALSLLGRPVLGRWLRTDRARLLWLALIGANLACLFALIGWHYHYPKDWPL